ncbi:MAG TPA: TonB-dependent receptor, partial [Steroidobacter sp.]
MARVPAVNDPSICGASNGSKRNGSIALIASAVALALGGAGSLYTQTASAQDVKAADKEEQGKLLALEEVVVTGVFLGIKKEEATVAISTLDSLQMENLVPQSAADLITNVPGVFVNSAHGEIRNVIYSRGVSANSLDGATGYYYVAMEEDGLPVTNVTWSNFGPDYFLRADVTVDRLEAVRGGAAAITGPNAPGGLFNYIMKRGGAQHEGKVRLRSGLEGDGRNPYYRGDVWFGGPLAENWTYSIGGFYRRSDGSQYPRFPLNEGGQIKFNVTRELDDGYLQVYGKYLDDTNGFTNFIPARNFNDPRPAAGWHNYSNPTPPRTAFDYQIGPNEFERFDSSRLQENKSEVIGLRFEKSFAGGWTLKNDMKYSNNRTVWNSWVGILPQTLTDIFTPVFYGTLGQLGTYTYRTADGSRVARVEQTGLLTSTVVESNLPMHDVMPGGVMAQVALDLRPSLKEFMDQISITKEFDTMSFTLGAFVALSDAKLENRSAGFGVSTIEPNPQALHVTLETLDGRTLQVTNDAGIGPATGFTRQTADWDHVSAFFGHRWDFAPNWTLDWGVRAERIEVNARNAVAGANPVVVSPTGGLDGDPDTLYDNRYIPRPTQYLDFGRDITNEAWSAAILRQLTPRQSLYFRYSNGAKAPDLAVFFAQSDPANVDFANTSSQEIEQYELGYKYAGTRASLVVTPYFSVLDNIQTTQRFVNPADGVAYPRISTNALEAYGIEFEGDFDLGNGFGLRAALTWQKAEATKRFNWVQGPTPEQDQLVDLSGSKADNNPDLMATITPSYTNGSFYAQAQWRYMGERPANANEAFTL